MPPANDNDRPSELSDTASSGPGSGAPLSEIFGLDPQRPQACVDPLLGIEIGGVRIVRFVAEGGMGRVYEGRQERPNRPVAVKVMRPGLATPSIIKRFEYEAEILARLRHPGIAQIYAAGVHTAAGAPVPYFIMEFIPSARPLTRYADDLKLTTRARLDLFRGVCDAVAHGHQRGVIHRDLKPNNILVDSSGQPKVIDFGVAKVTDSDVALTTMQTDVGQLIGTLQYMGPEQLAGDPNEIDIRCDVYALGVVLYELLTGRLPYDLRQKAVFEVMRIVREEEPTPISSLNRTLRRDVAVIAGKCLDKNRTRRYSSAGELAADIARHLAGEPISASPPRFIEGVVRLARRHRAAAWAVAGVFAALVVAILGISVFAARADRQRLEAEAARTLAEQQRTAAETERRRADQESERANTQLYQANLYRVGRMIADGDYANATAVSLDLKESLADGQIPLELAHYLAALDQSSMTLSDHTDAVSGVAFSPDGTRFVTGSKDGTARICDAITGKLLVRLDHPSPVAAVAYHPDGKLIATGARDGNIRLWDTESGSPPATGQPLTGHRFEATSVAFSPDGKWLASGSVDATVRIWNLHTRRLQHTLRGHTSRVLALAFSPNSKTVVSAGTDYTVRFWDTESGTSTTQWPQRGFVQRLAFTPCGSRLAVTGSRNSVQLIDLDDQTTITVQPGHLSTVLSIAFSSDGLVGATAGEEGTIRTWHVADGSPIAVFPGHRDAVAALVFSPDGKRLLSGSRDRTARLWDTDHSGMAVRLTGHTKAVNSFGFSPDGNWLATGSWDGTVRIWSLPKAEQIAVLYGPPSRKYAVAFSPDASYLASANYDGTITIWDLRSGAELRTLTGHTDQVFTVTFSPDGRFLATGGRDGMFRLWHMPSGELFATNKRRGGAGGGFIYGIDFSPNGDLVAVAGGGPDPVRIFGRDGRLQHRLDTGPTFIDWAKFHPKHNELITGGHDGTVRSWRITSHTNSAVFRGHKAKIHGLDFSPDGSRLVTTSADFTVRFWDTSQAVELFCLTFPYAVRAVACSPRGDAFVVAGPGSDVSIYGLPNSLIRAARSQSTTVRSAGLLAQITAGQDTASVKHPLRLDGTGKPLSSDAFREARELMLSRVCVSPSDPAWHEKVLLEDCSARYEQGGVAVVDLLAQFDKAFPLGVDTGQNPEQVRLAGLLRVEVLLRLEKMALANEKRGQTDGERDRQLIQARLQESKTATDHPSPKN